MGDRIVHVGENRVFPADVDLGDVALLPALVNAHTHLEFSLLEAPLAPPAAGFCNWIREVIRHRQERAPNQAEAIVAGLQESRRAQVAAIGEIASQPWPLEVASALGDPELKIGGVVFRELLGLAPDREAALLDAAAVHLHSPPFANLRAGLSPHAPYTASPELIRRAVEVAVSRGAPVAMHLAETTEELELLASHSGPMRILLDELDAWSAGAIPRGIRPLDYLRLLSPAPRALVIHGNYLTTDEIAFVGERAATMSVVYCPRTHAYFGHGAYRLADLVAAGANVALGTDSRASSPDLNLWSEAQTAAEAHPNVSPAEILRMATNHGAKALGIENAYGSLGAGKRASFWTLPISAAEVDDPHELLFAG